MGHTGRCHSCPVSRHRVCTALAQMDSVRSGRSSILRRYPKGHLLLDGSRVAERFGIIVTGVAKLLHIAEDGHQKIVGLLFPGDFVGQTQPLIPHLIAEAASSIDVCCFPRRTFDSLLKRNPTLEPAMYSHTLLELDDVRAWTRMLTHRPALERLAHFLVKLDRRMRRPGHEQPSDVMELPLSRTELADYLGMTIETLSRQLTRLRSAGIIETSGRFKVRIKYWQHLDMLASAAETSERDAQD